MAATDARPVPRKNVAFRAYFPILDADGDLVTGAASLDSEYSVDGGTFSDCTNEATEIATSSGIYYLDLTSGEMNGDAVVVIVKTSTTGAKTTVLAFYPEEVGDVRVDDTVLSDGLLNRDLSTGSDSGSETIRTVRQALRILRNKWVISGGTLTVYKENDSTASWTSSVTGNAAADPITASDPTGS